MMNVRIDTAGELRCWRCGSSAFKEKRTLKSKATLGVGALLTKKKLKCQACSSYNQTGNAQPYKGPSSKRLGKKYGTFTNMHGVEDGAEVEDTPTDEGLPPAEQVRQLAALRDEGLLTDDEFEAKKREILGL